MGGRPNGGLLEETERKLQSPLGAPRITEQPRRHDSFARYIYDPMTQGYSPGGGCRSCGTVPRKLPRSPGPFLVVSSYTIWTHGHNPSHTSCDSWPSVQLGAGIRHARHVYKCVDHGKQHRTRFMTVPSALEPDIAPENAVFSRRPLKTLLEDPP